MRWLERLLCLLGIVGDDWGGNLRMLASLCMFAIITIAGFML